MLYHQVPKKIILRPRPSAAPPLTTDFPLLTRIYQARGVKDAVELERSLIRLPAPSLLPGMNTMVERLAAALREKRKILIVADFDADGATSCALAIKGLRALGAVDPVFIVPNRFEYGYGLTPEIVALAAQQNPDVLLTVDNGISSLEGVAAAKARGWTVLITDHHLPGAQLPTADAIVNPALPGSAFPSYALAGVGVMFYVLMALRQHLRAQDWFNAARPEPNLGQWLDLVALGTVADVVPLDEVNRILVYQGLQRIRSGACCPGLQALISVAGRDRDRLTAADLGFAVAPRLNAAGRMDDMTWGIECLLSEHQAHALMLAQQLDELNRERREVEARMKQEALVLLERLTGFDAQHVPAGVCLYDEQWHQGVIGILASRIKDRLHRPVIAFAPSDNGELKGSARSIPGLHIRDVLSDIAAAHPKLLEKFGGHAMAAGLSLKRCNYPPFALAFDEAVTARLVDVDLDHKIYSDGELTADLLTLETAERLRAAGPWGQGFPEPLFHGEFDVVQARVVAQHHLKLVLRLDAQSPLIEAIVFYIEQPERWLGTRRVLAVYALDINDYQNRQSLQLVIEYLQKLA